MSYLSTICNRKTFLNNVRIFLTFSPFGILLANNTIGLLANTRKMDPTGTESTVYGTDNPYIITYKICKFKYETGSTTNRYVYLKAVHLRQISRKSQYSQTGAMHWVPRNRTAKRASSNVALQAPYGANEHVPVRTFDQQRRVIGMVYREHSKAARRRRSSNTVSAKARLRCRVSAEKSGVHRAISKLLQRFRL